MTQFTHLSGLPQLQQLTTKEIKGRRHYLLPDGSYVPSVTTVLGFFKSRSLMEWRTRVGEEEAQKITTQASIRGTKFHTLMEKYLSNEPVKQILTEKVMPNLHESFHMMKKVLDNNVNNIHYIEAPLYSTILKTAGRTDVIAEYDGKLSVIDFKTSRKEKPEKFVIDYFLQSTAYALMHEELTKTPINQIVILMASDGIPEPQIFVKETQEYIQPLIQKFHEYYEINGTVK